MSDITTADLAAEATDYVRSIGLTDTEIAQLKSNLSEPVSDSTTYDAGVKSFFTPVFLYQNLNSMYNDYIDNFTF